LEGAKQSKELPENFNVEVAAQVIVTYLQGLFRVIRVLQNRAQVEQQVEMLLQGLGL
jgi:TetR/AcrR family transcriptional repressor of nem operon